MTVLQRVISPRVLHLPRRALCTSSTQLLPLQESITLGWRRHLDSSPSKILQPRLAVVGSHTHLFAATLRAVGASDGAVVAPIDSKVHDREGMLERIAEVQANFVIVADACPVIDSLARDVARRVGATWVSATSLRQEGHELVVLEAAAESQHHTKNGQSTPATTQFTHPPLFFFSSRPGYTSVRAAYVPDKAVVARVSDAVDFWQLTKADTVLSLGLRADCPSAVVDAMQAPLSIGASVSLPEWRSPPKVWDLWAAIRDEIDATILFLPVERCEELLKTYEELSGPLRMKLAKRWESQPLRYAIAVASPGITPSTQLAQQWFEVFKCRLLWLFSCAEAGSLYVAQPDVALSSKAQVGTNGLELDLVGNELWARGAGVFDCYHKRPRSSSEAFNHEGFCQTGHCATVDGSGLFWPQLEEDDSDLEAEVERHLVEGPEWEKLGMGPNWRVKKVKMRKYWYWRPKKGYKIITKKDNQNALHLRYTNRYKRMRTKGKRKARIPRWMSRYR